MKSSSPQASSPKPQASPPWSVALLFLLITVAAGQSALILLERQPLLFDPLTNLMPAVMLRQAIETGTAEAWRFWVAVTDFRPPLTSIIYQPLLLLLDDQVHAMRFTDLGIFLLVIWQISWLGRRLSGPAAGFVAAFLFAAYPLTLGWSIMGNADPQIWAVLLLLFRVLLWLDMRSPWQAVVLGLSVGLCTATRLLCLVFLVAPFLWVLATRLRSLRSLYGLLGAVMMGLCVSGWWYIMQFKAVLDNVTMSSESQEGFSEFDQINYLADGYWLVLVGTAAAGWVIWRRGLLTSHQRWLISGWVLLPALQLSLIWDYWARYPLSVLPQCALMTGIALDQLTRAWPQARRGAALAATLILGGLPLAAYHAGASTLLPGVELPGDRGANPLINRRYGSGLLIADIRPYDALHRVLSPLEPGTSLIVAAELDSPHYSRGILLSQRRPAYTLYGPPDPDMLFGKPENIQTHYLLTVQPDCGDEPPDHYFCVLHQPDGWLQEEGPRLTRRLVGEARDPNGGLFRLYQLTEPL